MPFTHLINDVFDGLEDSNIFKLFLNDPRIDLSNQIGFQNISIDLQTASKKMNITFNPTLPDHQELEQNPQEPLQQPFTVSLDLGVDTDLKPTEAGFLLNIANRNYLKQNSDCQISVDGVVLTQDQKNSFFNRKIFSDLFKGLLEEKTSESLAPMVLLNDGYLRLKNDGQPNFDETDETNAKRFFEISKKLPLEMQSTIAEIKASNEEQVLKETTGTVKGASVEKAVKNFFRNSNGQGGQQN